MDGEATDLTNCDREPIRIPGAIQPHGALLAIGPDSPLVTHASGNLEEFFGVTPPDAVGRPLSELITVGGDGGLDRWMTSPENELPAHLFLARSCGDGREFDAIAHRAGEGRVIIEFEPKGEAARPPPRPTSTG